MVLVHKGRTLHGAGSAPRAVLIIIVAAIYLAAVKHLVLCLQSVVFTASLQGRCLSALNR